MVNWRDYLKQDESQVNYPLFKQSDPEEDGIFIYSGYFKPGIHNLVIYDPILQKFLRIDNLVAFPR